MTVDVRTRLDPTLAPAEPEERARPQRDPRPALCLSGGGYRAMLFHLGALWRLNELGWLPRLGCVSSVSGGSIAAALLGLRWRALGFEGGVARAFGPLVAEPLHRMASTPVDVRAIVCGLALPFTSVPRRVEAAYRRCLFGAATLQDLPAEDEGPRFVLNATSVQTGALFRFSRAHMGDYRVGQFVEPDVPLARAVAASSAFPPFLSPAELRLGSHRYRGGSGRKGYAAFRERAVLTDGGVYDNLGLEAAWKQHEVLLVSDGGGAMAPELAPARGWMRHVVRVLEVVDNQVRSLRKRSLIGSFETGARRGAYWGIRTDLEAYPARGPIPVERARALELADEPTRLAPIAPARQRRLVNWGYAVCDAAMRSHLLAAEELAAAPEAKLPYPGDGV